MRSMILAGALLFGSHSYAFDFGGLMQTMAPVAESVAPVADNALSSNPLIKNMTGTLGVTPTQAIGGTAAILNDAKSKMSPTDFSSLTKQMPDVGTLLSAAPAGMLEMGSVGSQFSFLGMDPSMIGKFTPLILQYVQTGATPGTAQLLQAALAQ